MMIISTRNNVKVNIEFDLPDDQLEYDRMTIAHKMHESLNDISNLLRSIEKYGESGDLDGCYHERFFETIKGHIRDSGIHYLE